MERGKIQLYTGLSQMYLKMYHITPHCTANSICYETQQSEFIIDRHGKVSSQKTIMVWVRKFEKLMYKVIFHTHWSWVFNFNRTTGLPINVQISLGFFLNFHRQILNLFINCYKTSSLGSKLQSRPLANMDKYKPSGVYKISCSIYPKFYIGQTGQTFSERFREYLSKGTTD